MTRLPAWLPPLITLELCRNDWNTFLAVLYACFSRDFVASRPSFRGRRLQLKRHPIIDGKEATFWHLVSDGSVEANRLPNLRRCERIGWPRPTIENETDGGVRVWSERNGGDTRIHIWVVAADYLVVLADRGEYILPWTAFPIDREHTRRKLERRYLVSTNN